MTAFEAKSELPVMDVASRTKGLREALDPADCDALIVTDLVNVRYLSGFTGSAGIVVVTAEEMVFITDGRYGEQSHDELAAAGVEARIEVVSGSSREALVAATSGCGRIGLEAGNVTWARQRELADDWLAGSELVPTEGLVEQLRIIKDDGEIARLRSACSIADAALAEMRASLGAKMTEHAFSLALDDKMRELGAEAISFDTIVASGPNGARPHAQPGDRVILEGDLVVIDFGAVVDGYHSDMTRTFIVGDTDERSRHMYDVVREAQQAGFDAVRAGVSAKAVDSACRDVITGAGMGDAFVHGTGHGIGLEIHEAPRVASTSDDTLRAGYTITVEPGVYLPDHGGVRIEDSLVVTEDGFEFLTGSPRDPEP